MQIRFSFEDKSYKDSKAREIMHYASFIELKNIASKSRTIKKERKLNVLTLK